MTRQYWTTAEERALREVWAGDKPLKMSMYLFPNRTIYAVLLKARKMGLSKRRSERSIKYDETLLHAAVRKALQRSPATVAQLMERSGVSQTTVYNFIKRNHKTDEKRIHICRWIKYGTGSLAAVYAWGEGDDVRAPRAKSDADRWVAKKRLQILRADISPFRTAMQQVAA